MLAGAAGAVSDPDRDRDRGDQPQHPAPVGDRDDGGDRPPAHRRPLRARSRPRLRPALRPDGPAEGDRRAARGRDRIYRRLWRGEAFDHDGPAGRYPFLSLDSSFDERIPVLMMAIGDRSLELAGRVADGVVLHTFLTDETLARSVGVIRKAAAERGPRPRGRAGLGGARHRPRRAPRGAPAAQAGRPAGDVPPGLRRRAGPRQRLGPRGPRAVPGRPAGPGLPGRLRRDRDRRGPDHAARAGIPAEWLAAAASGSAAAARPGCSTSSTPAPTASSCTAPRRPSSRPVVEAYAAIRPAGRFDHLPANPGWSR